MNNQNKLLIDELEKELHNFHGVLEITSSKALIHLEGNNFISGLNIKENSSLKIILEPNATLELKDFWDSKNNHCHIQIDSTTNTILKWNVSILSKIKYHSELTNNVLGNNNKTNIKIHVVTELDGSCFLKSTGKVFKNTKDNEFLEELKGLNLNDQGIIFLPDLIIESDMVTANHNATIKCFEEEELFYLKSKGINELEAEELMKNGFLNSILEGR